MSRPRGTPARVGIAAINLLAPGLGLLRVERPRAALFFILVAPAVYLLLLAFLAAAPDLGFGAYSATIALVVATILAALAGSIWLSWRWSRNRPERHDIWARWYVLAAGLLGYLLLTSALVEAVRGLYQPFYLPSEAMAPTLRPGDRFVARMDGPGTLRRGDVVLLDVNGTTYVKRIAALPGDRIELVDGKVILNGAAVSQRIVGIDQVSDFGNPQEARRLAERFPGEAHPHQIYDVGFSVADDFPETVVRPGHVFVLGDHRDRSADSRFPREQWGVEQLPVSQIRGRPLFYWFFSESGRTGAPVR